jgi:hypothetical protein
MQRIFSLTLSVIVFILIVAVITGYMSGGDYEGEYNFIIQERKSEVWDILVDIENYSKGKKDVSFVELRRYQNLYAWTEILDNNSFRKYRQIEKDEGNKLVIEMTDSSDTMKGTWEFSLYEKNQQTYIKIKEKSNVSSIVRAGFMFYFGRDRETQRWVKYMKIRIFGRLLSTL